MKIWHRNKLNQYVIKVQPISYSAMYLCWCDRKNAMISDVLIVLLRGGGWCSGESACLPLLWPRFNSWTWPHIVGRVCCWFSSGLWGCFFGFSGFHPPHPQKPTLQNPLQHGISGRITTLWNGCATAKFYWLIDWFKFGILFLDIKIQPY